MKKLLLVFVFCQLSYAQNQKLGVVLDAETRKAVEFVDVYNAYDHTITNENGKFFLLSSNDSISFNKLGYEPVRSTFLQISDTVLLRQKAFELSEVVLTNKERLFDKVKKAVPSNYPSEPYNERFFLRSVLRYNDEITRIQDIQGKLKRRTLLYHGDLNLGKKDFLFEVEHMRKIGLKEVVAENDEDVEYISKSLRTIFMETVQVSIVLDDFEIEELYFDNKEKVRIAFTFNGEDKRQNVKGYYTINLKDKAILEFYQLSEFNLEFRQSKNIRYRAKRYEKTILFDKDPKTQKYILKNAKIKTKVEITDEESSFQTFFESEDILDSYAHFGKFKVRKNANENKEIFKLRFPYDLEFWEKQNTLLLTDEMNAFIAKVSQKNSEFKVRSNMD